MNEIDHALGKANEIQRLEGLVIHMQIVVRQFEGCDVAQPWKWALGQLKAGVEEGRDRIARAKEELAAIRALPNPVAECDGELRSAVEAAAGHLGVALMQAIPSDDQIIIGHVRSAHVKMQAALRRAS